MGMEGTGLSVADALALQDRRSDGMFGDGGNGIWVLFLFFLLAGGRGFGFGGDSAAAQYATQADIQRGFDHNNVISKLDGITNGLCDGFYAQNTTMLNGLHSIDTALCNGFNNVNNNITQARFDAQQCCCETNRNIDAVRYENAKNTCDIIQAGNANTQRLVDLMTQDKIEALRTELQSAQLALHNNAQTQTLIDTLRPCPIPAYATCSPYTTNAMNCGF